MKVAIIGGHLTPALAVIQKMPKDMEVVYIGRKYPVEGDKAISLEYHTMTGLGIPFIPITTAKFHRQITRHTLPSLAKLPDGLSQSFRILKKYHPDIVLSFGGYVSVPICFAAYLLKIPVIIHEQTTQAGIANKITSFLAKKVCISFLSSKQFFPKEKVILTGNPILKTMPTKDIGKYKKTESNRPLLVVTGGSQGSHIINTLISEIVPRLLDRFQIIHQTGDAKEYNDFDQLTEKRKTLAPEIQKRYLITKFIHPYDIESVYKEADIVVSRSGINTVLTLLMLHKPAILIPLPYGQKNEQLKNAQMFHDAGLGEICLQHQLTAEMLLKKIQSMDKHIMEYKDRKPETMQLHAHAAENIITLLHTYGHKTNQQKV